MPIPDSILGSWSHHHSGMASKQAHLSIREALASYSNWSRDDKYELFLQGSYKNDTNLRRDSDVDLVVQLAIKLRPRVAALAGLQLEEDPVHRFAYQRWHLFRNKVFKALRATYGNKAVTSGRKSLKLANGEIPASADVVVTLHCENGLAFYLPSEHRWVVSHPQQHYERGVKKEQATNGRYKRTIRIFKSARNQLIEKEAINERTAPSYFIECLLYNVPDSLFRLSFGQSYTGIVNYLTNTQMRHFECQNGVQELFGPSKDLWNVDDARRFIRGLSRLWEKWPGFA